MAQNPTQSEATPGTQNVEQPPSNILEVTVARPESIATSAVINPMEESLTPNSHLQALSTSLSMAPNSTYTQEVGSVHDVLCPPRSSKGAGTSSALTTTQISTANHGDNTSLLTTQDEKRVPTPTSPAHQINASEAHNTTRMNLKAMAWLVFRRTAGHTLLGIAFMILGIGVVQRVILPRIYTCPPNTTCSTFWDPNKSNILNLLQILMGYWLKLGLVVASPGLLKLSAFQSWFVLMKHGNTIDNLDLHLGAIKGSLLDAARLVLRKRNFILSLLVLALIGIDSGITLFVGLSINRTPGSREITFTYQDVSELPNSKLTHLNTDGQVDAIAKVVSWAIANDTTHNNALRGSLIVPDARTNFSTNPKPAGPIIDGTLSCSPIQSENITRSTIINAPLTYTINITVSGRLASYLVLSNTLLGVSEAGGIDTATGNYLWVSNTSGLLPNATVIDNGAFYATRCQHFLFMRNASNDQPEAQDIRPNTAYVPGCDADPDACVADSVSNAILNWWGGLGQAIWDLSCRGGVLGPLSPENASGPCPLTIDVWRETATSMLDGIMQSSPTEGLASQQLIARVQNIDPSRWWLQGLIPAFALLLYFISLIYTCYLSQGNTALKELNLAEVIGAAQTEHIRDLVQTGRLGKSIVQYRRNQGFLSTENA